MKRSNSQTSLASATSPIGQAANKPTQGFVRKRREVQEKRGSSEDDEEWFASEAAGSSEANVAKQDGKGSRKYNVYWSKLLGCKIQAERKKKKPKILVLGELMSMYLLKEHGLGKEERLRMIKIVIDLLRKDGVVKSRVPIDEAVRQRVAAERRWFRFGEDATDLIQVQQKKNAAVLQFIQVELRVTQDLMKDVDDRERRRRKREQLKEAAAKMGMSVEELEAARAKRGTFKSGKAGDSPLQKASSPLRRQATSPLRRQATSPLGMRTLVDDSFQQTSNFRRGSETSFNIASPLAAKMQQATLKSIELARKASVKVLDALGYSDTQGEVDFSEHTAEMDFDLRVQLAAHMEKVASELHGCAELDAQLRKRLEERKQHEEVYRMLLEYLDTLPATDKDGQPMSLAALKDIAKMERKKVNQLAINRIQLRFGMERAYASNDAFLGKSELMRISALLRTVVYVKAYMIMYKHAQQSIQMRAIGERIGFNSTASLRKRVLGALRANCDLNKTMRIKLKDATKFFSKSVTIRNECFLLWVHVHRLDKQMAASRLKSLAQGARALKASVFDAWARILRNKKRAMARWTNGLLLWALGLWSGLLHETHEFECLLEGKLGGRLLAAGKVLRGLVFKEWQDVVRKKKRAMKRWTHSALVHMWQLWVGECAERWALYAQVQDKCKSVAARLKGAWRDLCFHAWSASVLKDRRARARFVNATLYMCLSSWKGLAREEVRKRELLANISMRIHRRCEIVVLGAYRAIVAERRRVKLVLKRILLLWVDRSRRAALASIWRYKERAKRHRQIVADAHVRLVRRREDKGFQGLRLNFAQERRIRVVLARVRNRPAAVCLELWNKHVLDVLYAQQRALAAKSPVIARFLKRSMVEAFEQWHALAAETARQLRILKRIRTRVVYATVILALQRWGEFMEDQRYERHEELMHCAHLALHEGALQPLQEALARHHTLPHVRRDYSAQQLRRVMAQLLAAEGASAEVVRQLDDTAAEASVAAAEEADSAAAAAHDDGDAGRSSPRAGGATQRGTTRGGQGVRGMQRAEAESAARFRGMEKRKHLQAAFARVMRCAVERLGHGAGVRLAAAPARPATILRDVMGELFEEREVKQRQAASLQVFSKAQRLDTGAACIAPATDGDAADADPGVAASGRSRGATAMRSGQEAKSHGDATQWVLGVLPPMKIANRLGVGRLHGDSFYASSLPVPVTDLNCTVLEVKMGARHRIWDAHDPLPPRVFRHGAEHAAAEQHENGEQRGWEQAALREVSRGGGGGGGGKHVKHGTELRRLGAADLIAFEADRYAVGARKYLDKGKEQVVQDRLGHFQAVLGIPDLRATAPAVTLKDPKRLKVATMTELWEAQLGICWDRDERGKGSRNARRQTRSRSAVGWQPRTGGGVQEAAAGAYATYAQVQRVSSVYSAHGADGEAEAVVEVDDGVSLSEREDHVRARDNRSPQAASTLPRVQAAVSSDAARRVRTTARDGDGALRASGGAGESWAGKKPLEFVIGEGSRGMAMAGQERRAGRVDEEGRGGERGEKGERGEDARRSRQAGVFDKSLRLLARLGSL